MTHKSSRYSRIRTALTTGLAAFLVTLITSPAAAGPNRARLSRDLADRLASGSEQSTSVIVSGTDADVQTLAARYGARIKKSLRRGAVLDVTGGQLAALSQDPDVMHLSGDAPVFRMSVTEVATGADQVWRGLDGLAGFTGRGIGVAIIDSGVAAHKSLKGRVVAAVDFTESRGVGRDQYGHGTHVAGIVAGTDSDYAGLAPGAHIVSLKVLGADGSGDTSTVIDAIDWAIDHRAEFNLRVINLSLGHPVFESWRDDPLCLAVQRAVDAGLVVVAAAGNLGKTDDGRPIVGGIVSPGNTPAALTVGALNTRNTPQRSDDVMATYSSRGPTMIDGVLKPELVAPGNKIVAAAAPGSTLVRDYPERVVGHGAGAYLELSGTSMATAVVSGAVALLLEANPQLTPEQTKIALQITSSRVAGAGLIEAGAGSLNVAAAVELAKGRGLIAPMIIAGETSVASELAYFVQAGEQRVGMASTSERLPDWTGLAPSAVALRTEGTLTQSEVWGTSIVWGCSIVWGANIVSSDSIVWGADLVSAGSIVWGSNVSPTSIVWGSSIVWGADVTANSIVWGS